MTRPFFSRDRVTHFDIFERHAQGAIKQLRARLSEGHPVDMQVCIKAFCYSDIFITQLGPCISLHDGLSH